MFVALYVLKLLIKRRALVEMGETGLVWIMSCTAEVRVPAKPRLAVFVKIDFPKMFIIFK
jgi:hypothetical protein